METYLARTDRIIRQAEFGIAAHRNGLAALKASGADLEEAERTLGVMLEWLDDLRANRRRIETGMTARINALRARS